jgi:hypothetical protein
VVATVIDAVGGGSTTGAACCGSTTVAACCASVATDSSSVVVAAGLGSVLYGPPLAAVATLAAAREALDERRLVGTAVSVLIT